MIDTAISLQDKKVKATTKELRLKNFKNNLPFLILSVDLPEGQAYREFADGHIEIHEVYDEGADLKSKLIRTLTDAETLKVRIKYGLF